MRLIGLAAVAWVFVLGAAVGTGCTASSSTGVSSPDAGVCIGCNTDAMPFDVGVIVLHCQELDDAGLPICGEVLDEAAGIACQSQNGQLTTACPTGPIGECEDFADGGAVQWLGPNYYYGLGDAGQPDAAAQRDGGGADASTGALAESDCHSRHGTWVAAQ